MFIGTPSFPAELELIDRQTEQRNDQTDEGGTGVLQQGIQAQRIMMRTMRYTEKG